MNRPDDRLQHRLRIVLDMNRLTSLLQGLGAAGATANARDELVSAYDRNLQATIVAERVTSYGLTGYPLSPVSEARVA